MGLIEEWAATAARRHRKELAHFPVFFCALHLLETLAWLRKEMPAGGI